MHNSNSPIRNSSSVYLVDQDQGDSFANKYLSEYSNSRGHHFGGQLIREQLESQIQIIQTSLNTLLPDRIKLGDLFSQNIHEVEKTVEVIKFLLSQRQRDMQTRNEIYANSRKMQNERMQLGVQMQKMQKQLKRCQTERDNLLLKLKSSEKSYKQSLQKITQQKQDHLKKYKAIEARQNQYRNQMRKLETTIKTLQDKINKGQDKSNFKNSFELMQQLQIYSPTIIMMNAEHEYNQVVAKTMEENYLQISRENQYYKDCLQGIQKEMQTVLDIKKEVLKRRKGYETEYDSTFDLKSFKPELLNMPHQYSKQGISQLNQNVAKFKEAMKFGQSLDDRESDQKINCVSNVKNLIRNYKNVVESQEQLLNRVILKAKQFKTSEMQALQNRYSKGMDEDEIERAKKFLEQQSHYLEGKNKELQMTRKAMQSTIRKAQQQRQQFSRRSSLANEQILKIKKQVELLPVLVQQQLNIK